MPLNDILIITLGEGKGALTDMVQIQVFIAPNNIHPRRACLIINITGSDVGAERPRSGNSRACGNGSEWLAGQRS